MNTETSTTIDKLLGQADDYARAWADAQSATMGDRVTAYAYRAEERESLRAQIAAALDDRARQIEALTAERDALRARLKDSGRIL